MFKDNVSLNIVDTFFVNGEEVLLKVFGRLNVHQCSNYTLLKHWENRKGF